MANEKIFCEACGFRLPSQAQFCESCGQKVGVPPPPRTPAATAGPCPKCRLSDQTFPISEFVRQDFSHVKPREGEGDLAALQGSLARPEQPQLPGVAYWLVVPLIPILNFLGIWFAPLHQSYKWVMAGLASLFVVCVAVPGLYEFGAYAFVGIAILVVYYGGLIADRGRQKIEWEQKLLPEWVRMAENWEKARYCRGCNVAWLPQEPGRQVSPDNLRQLLGV